MDTRVIFFEDSETPLVRHFYQSLAAMSETIHSLVRNTSFFCFFDDGLMGLRKDIAFFSCALTRLRLNVNTDEKTRGKPRINEDLNEQANSVIRKLELSYNRVDQLKEDYEQKKAKLKLIIDRKNEELDNEKLNNIQKAADNIDNRDRQLEILNIKKTELQEMCAKLETKIDDACCPCLPSNKKDVKALHKDKRELSLIKEDIQSVIQKISSHPGVRPEIIKLESDLKILRSKQDEHIDNEFSEIFQKAQAALEEARKEKDMVDISIQREKDKELAIVANVVMFDVLLVYVHLIKVIHTVTVHYSEIGSKKHKRTTKETSIEMLYNLLLNTKKNTDQILEKMWCPASDNRTGTAIYQAYLKVDERIKVQFYELANNIGNNELIEIIVPQTEILLKNVLLKSAAISTSPLSEVVELFPKDNKTLNNHAHKNLTVIEGKMNGATFLSSQHLFDMEQRDMKETIKAIAVKRK